MDLERQSSMYSCRRRENSRVFYKVKDKRSPSVEGRREMERRGRRSKLTFIFFNVPLFSPHQANASEHDPA